MTLAEMLEIAHPGSGTLGWILASMLMDIQNFLYSPGKIVDIFFEFNKYTWSVFANGWFMNIYKICMSVGIGFLVVGFLISLMDKVSNGDFSPAQFQAHLIKYFLLYMVVLNARKILELLLAATTHTFVHLNNEINKVIVAQSSFSITKAYLANSIHEHLGLGSKLGLFVMLIIPFGITLLYTVVVCFLACSRFFEMVIRMTVVPLVAGVSFFGKGENADIIRFIKKTMGIIFQIIVVLVISTSTTFVHNSMVIADTPPTNQEQDISPEDIPSLNPENNNQSNPSITPGVTPVITPEIAKPSLKADIKNPATVLTIDDAHIESCYDGAWSGNDLLSKQEEEWLNQGATMEQIVDLYKVYTEESTHEYINHIIEPESFCITVAIMMASLMLVFKSRYISTTLFM